MSLYFWNIYHWQILLSTLNVWLIHYIRNAAAQPRCNSSQACCHKSGRKSQTCRPTKTKVHKTQWTGRQAYYWPLQNDCALKQISMTKMKENTSENQHASGIPSVPDWQLQLVQLTRHKIANGPWQRSIRIIHAQTQKNCLRSRKASKEYSHQTLIANDTWPFTNHQFKQSHTMQ